MSDGNGVGNLGVGSAGVCVDLEQHGATDRCCYRCRGAILDAGAGATVVQQYERVLRWISIKHECSPKSAPSGLTLW